MLSVNSLLSGLLQSICLNHYTVQVYSLYILFVDMSLATKKNNKKTAISLTITMCNLRQNYFSIETMSADCPVGV